MTATDQINPETGQPYTDISPETYTLEYMGTNAGRWARGLVAAIRSDSNTRGSDELNQNLLVAWFANAIQAGYRAVVDAPEPEPDPVEAQQRLANVLTVLTGNARINLTEKDRIQLITEARKGLGLPEQHLD